MKRIKFPFFGTGDSIFQDCLLDQIIKSGFYSLKYFLKEESPHFRFRSLFDRSHFLLLILLIFREKVRLESKFYVASVYILLESYLKNNEPVKLENSKCSKYANFS